MFGHLLLKVGGGGDIQACNIMEGGEGAGTCPWWGGGRGGVASPPPRNWKKDAVRGNFNLFHLCFTNEIRGDRQTLHTCKMEGGRRIGASPWWEEVEGGGGEGALPTPRN